MSINYRKAAIVGCGFVGASIAFRFLQQGTFSHLVLLDANHAKAEGEAMDLSDGLPYGSAMEGPMTTSPTAPWWSSQPGRTRSRGRRAWS